VRKENDGGKMFDIPKIQKIYEKYMKNIQKNQIRKILDNNHHQKFSFKAAKKTLEKNT